MQCCLSFLTLLAVSSATALQGAPEQPDSAAAVPTPPVSMAQPIPTIPAEAAAPGKDVVHQLNSAFAKVFEIVAPSVVIIEVTKKGDGNDASLDDLFFQTPDDNDPRQGRRVPEAVQSEGSGFIVRQDGFIYTN